MKDKNYQTAIDFLISYHKRGFNLDGEDYMFGEILNYLLKKVAILEKERDEIQEWKDDLLKRLSKKGIEINDSDSEHQRKIYTIYNGALRSIIASIDTYASMEMEEREDIYK